MALLTSWEFKLVEIKSVLNKQLVKLWNGITYQLTVQIDGNEVSIKLSMDGMALHTHWMFKLVDTNEVGTELTADGMALRTFWAIRLT